VDVYGFFGMFVGNFDNPSWPYVPFALDEFHTPSIDDWNDVMWDDELTEILTQALGQGAGSGPGYIYTERPVFTFNTSYGGVRGTALHDITGDPAD
jgi:hypothetical protein